VQTTALLLIELQGECNFVPQRIGSRDIALVRVEATKLFPFTLEAALPDVPAILRILLNRKKSADGGLVAELVSFLHAGSVQQTTLVEKDAPAARRAHDALAEPAPNRFEKTALHHYPASIRTHERQKSFQVRGE
jgi:hypothetical protein